MAARLKIIVLDRNHNNPNEWRCAFWADVPATRQSFYANQPIVVNGVWTTVPRHSVWKDALVADLAALENGSVVEMVDAVSVDSSLTVAQIQAVLQARWQAFQDQVNAVQHPWKRYGSTWDGITWSIANVT